jgi:hypothetical protein
MIHISIPPSLWPSSVHQVADTDVFLRLCSQRRPGAKAATREPCLANADDVVLEVPTAWRLMASVSKGNMVKMMI